MEWAVGTEKILNAKFSQIPKNKISLEPPGIPIVDKKFHKYLPLYL